MITPVIGSDFPKKVIPLIENATKSLDIIVFDWRWYPHDSANTVQRFNQSIIRAHRRGVRIRAIVNSPGIVSQLNSLGIKAKRFKHKKIVHCKMIIIDDSILVVGSHNYTQSAFHMNLELSIITNIPDSEPRFVEFFANLWSL